MKNSFLYFIALLFFFLSCNKQQQKVSLFTPLSSEYTGIDFINKIDNREDFNVFRYRNFYNGGGVAVGDINNDGFPDIYFTSNFDKNTLYLNNGDFTFRDITDLAKVGGAKAWSTGVVTVDINNDGYLDIYVCNAGDIEGKSRENELFINNGDLTFTESAAIYGLNENGFTTHAAFFDYDKDGDLDVYILNNSFIPITTLGYNNRRELRDKDWNVTNVLKGGGDKLLRNDNSKFVDVSQEAGIYGSLIGFGLGITIGDVNKDSYPDIYVSNDFYERDYLYINNTDGTFKEDIQNRIQHLSHASMGADMGDINNDGWPEIFVTDMLPEGDQRIKETTQFESFDLYQRKTKLGFHNQYMQNTLQLNTDSGNLFNEIAYFSDVAKTDWSWGALIFDMDNDGYKDIYVCNGIYHDLTNQDFIDFFANDIVQKMVLTGQKEDIQTIIDKMPSKSTPNYAFKNRGNLQFQDLTQEWGMKLPSFSNGSTYADLDNDGDLDLVVNNVNQEAFLFRNNTETISDYNYLKLNFKPSEACKVVIGTKVTIYSGKEQLYHELNPSKGFQSSSTYDMTIGLGKRTVDSLLVQWVDNRQQIIHNVALDTTITLHHKDAQEREGIKWDELLQKQWVSEIPNIFDNHIENFYVDFDHEGMISEMLSREGPPIAIADIDNDGHQDLYIGSSVGYSGALYKHLGNGKFTKLDVKAFEKDRVYEDTAAAFIDIDNDGDHDLLVGSGGNQTKDIPYGVRLYTNNGKGMFFHSPKKIPYYKENVSDIAHADFDNDGDIDVFISGRSVPGIYGVNPQHKLFQNDGKGNFIDVFDNYLFDLKDYGMITDVQWQDIDLDGNQDLLVVGDWQSPILMKNMGNRFERVKTSLDSLLGWWNTIEVVDINKDGLPDLLLGNQGLNIPYKPSQQSPIKLYINDFDDNGTIEQISTHVIDQMDKPIALKNQLTNQLVFLKKENLAYADYSTKTIIDLIPKDKVASSITRIVNTSQSIVALNKGNLEFEVSPLPYQAQFSCIYDFLCLDLNKNQTDEILVVGNNYNLKPQFGRLDANFGLTFSVNKTGNIQTTPKKVSGFSLSGEIKNIHLIKDNKGRQFIIAGRNNAAPKLFRVNE